MTDQPDRLLGFPTYVDPTVADLKADAKAEAKVIASGTWADFYARNPK